MKRDNLRKSYLSYGIRMELGDPDIEGTMTLVLIRIDQGRLRPANIILTQTEFFTTVVRCTIKFNNVLKSFGKLLT